MIDRIHIHHLRNLSQASLSFAKCNLIFGDNGSGKTSLLEAVFLLSRGKSFRHHEPKRYISHHQQACTIWASTNFQEQCTLAIQKQLDGTGKSDTLLKFNEQTAQSQSVLSFHLPTVLIDPSSMSLLDEGSGSRRQLLDWLAFHVKPEFYHQWLQYQRLLKQRNSLLKYPNIQHRINELTAWDVQLSHYAQALHEHRVSMFDEWQVVFAQMVTKLLPNYADKISLQYLAGFDTTQPLSQTLSARVMQDIELGYTRIGAHRADVGVILKTTNDDGQKLREQATHILSRGEKKLLITALRLSQLSLICTLLSQGKSAITHPPVVLIDDIDAELDDAATNILLDTVLSLPCQSIISTLNADIHSQILMHLQTLEQSSDLPNSQTATSYKMFHVKQGEFAEIYAQ
ncbi:DNA replication/repair protein RecF [Moraxella pluranimalium]|uniref:DNA replication and repair protein RecF n=1 Tax=Moraxella pluranimalium TaxID=470453 RepID=A0A1T0CEW9_9GAMM|nr:DNA replication and repair protein RecF [Moraxella pluranimalium]OOS20907.1 DNA recombination protein RecF [Moraxella pluranimalium]